MAKPISIFIADDHPVFTGGLIALLSAEPRFTLSGTANQGSDALAKIRTLQPGIAILDVSMPVMSGLEIARSVQREKLRTKIIILTMFDDGAYLHEALDAGVLGYLLKDSIAVEILKCITHVAEGKRYVSSALTDHVLQQHAPASGTPDDRIKELTPTERKVLKLVSQNKTSAQIADALFISTRTVQNHRVNIAAKLHLSGYNKLLEFALQNKKHFQK
jgi:DNA-binding NarL/FixJ family response regulator